MSKNSHFDYDSIVHEALRGAIAKILKSVEKEGLSGEHHFYVAFRTSYPGVDIPEHLKAKYPEEMTIVIQHRFWGLKVHKDRFEIGLSFNQKSELLVIPFSAIVGFVDPSAQFALQFEQSGDAPANAEDELLEPIDTPVSESADNQQKQKKEKADNSEEKTSDDNVVTLDAFRKNR